MAGVLDDLSEEIQTFLASQMPDHQLEIDGREWRVYEDKAAAAFLQERGFLNLGIGPASGASVQGVSLDKMKAVDLGTGYQGKKRAVVVSDIVGLSSDGEFLTLFHWDGFGTKLSCAKSELVDQFMSR